MEDEHIYEGVAQELASSPRQGLLIKCMAKCGGDENKGKAMYIEVRVDEIKREAKARIKREAKEASDKQAEQKKKSLYETQKGVLSDGFAICLGVGLVILLMLFFDELMSIL